MKQGSLLTSSRLHCSALLILLLLTVTHQAAATVAVTSLIGNNMVLQRDKPVPLSGTAAANKTITVTFNSQTVSSVSDAQGRWTVTLAAMAVKATGGTLTITEVGGNTLTFTNVVVGDVWVCSGQSNMAFGLSGCNRPTDITSANYPNLRHIWMPLANLGEPTRNFSSSWSVCSSSTAGGFSAVAFYFGRKIYLDQSSNIPIGLIASTVGGTCIDPWVAPDGCTDIPTLSPLFSQAILPWGPFSLFNGMIYPLVNFPSKGAIWYQGENRETTSQGQDSYFLKEKALQQGWRRLFGLDDFALYVVLLANYGTVNSAVAPDALPGSSWADTRLQQINVVGLPHAGVASALDVGDPLDIHPKDKLDVGERLALWALKNDYGRTVVPSGPILKDITVAGTNLICSFDYTGSGLMVGAKTNYQPTAEVVGGTLTNFSISGASGSWYVGNAFITDTNTVVVSSPSVTTPRRLAYACWQSPAQLNFYNREGLPANPFYVDDATVKYTITASAGAGGAISPAGSVNYLKRRTALYTITPDPGYYIQNVTVDGASVGAVRSYTFDPLSGNHTIQATFSTTRASYSIAASAAAGGSITPAGTSTVAQGGGAVFTVNPNPGALYAMSLDGKPVGMRDSYSFADVNTNHTLSVAFSFTINASSGFGGTISSGGSSVIPYGGNKTYTFTPLAGYSVYKVIVDGANAGSPTSYSFSNLVTNHTIAVSFAGPAGGGSVPQTSQLLFSALSDSLPASGSVANWPTYLPSGQTLTTLGTPTAETIDGRRFAKILHIDGDGFNQGTYASPIACNGASIVVAAKPMRDGIGTSWISIVDVFYDRLVLGILNDTGKIVVRRNGSYDTSSEAIPDGQTTVLSLVVQPNGTYKVWANGSPIYTNTTTSAMTALTNGVAGSFANNVTVGRNWPDGWTTFNGYIGDVFLHKTALSDTDRTSLEQYVAGRLMSVGGTCTISATAGSGGSITPAGDVSVTAGTDRTFSIAPNAGYAIQDVLVNGVSRGAVSSYTFTNVTAWHTIQASFVQKPVFSSVSTSGGDLFLVSSGAANSQTRLWTSTNVAAAVNLWIPVKTNLVGPNGLFTNRIPVNTAEPGRFYMLTMP